MTLRVQMAQWQMVPMALLTSLVLAACSTLPASTAPAVDRRSPIRLSAQEREHLRNGMRQYLESVQGVVDALSSRRLDRLSEEAGKSGMASVRGVSLATAASLPLEFTMLSLDTHEKFDALARLAARNASKKELLDQTGAILANCAACHAMYRLAEPW